MMYKIFFKSSIETSELFNNNLLNHVLLFSSINTDQLILKNKEIKILIQSRNELKMSKKIYNFVVAVFV